MKLLLKLFIIAFILFNSLNCSFQISIFNEMNKSKKGQNLIISPLSIFQILSLTTNGADSDTQLEMIQALQNEDLDQLNSINYEILEVLNKCETVDIANAVMARFTPLENFLEISENYCAPFEKLLSAQQVNNWCSEKTHGKIKKILDKLEDDVQMILLNAVYFKGEWSSKFEKMNTRNKTFYNLGTEEKVVDTMSQLTHFKYYEDNQVQAVELPYKKDKMSALVILPRKNVDINKYILSLDTEKDSLSNIISNLKSHKVSLELPKFELEFSSSLKEVLQNMGMEKAFTNNADFSGLRKDAILKIDEVLHKTYLKVNEDGTEAAAVTAVIITYGSAMPEPEIIYEMKVNRPFLFILRSNDLPKDNDILFISKIEKLK